MANKQTTPDNKQVVYVNPYDEWDKERPIKDNTPKAICRVLKAGNYLRNNVPGDRVSLEPKQAKWLERQGALVVEISSVLPQELKDAGGVEAYLAANPKADKLDKRARSRLKPIPGIPGADFRKPWDFEDED